MAPAGPEPLHTFQRLAGFGLMLISGNRGPAEGKACGRGHLGSTLAWLVFAVVYRAQLGGNDIALKLAKGCGHNCYGEPAWPNEIFYVFPVVIAGVLAVSVGVASAEPCRGLFKANSFVTPIEIVPEWYFLPSFNVLRLLDDKLIGVGTLVTFFLFVLLTPFVENSVVYQNPFRRFVAMSSFLYFSSYLLIATVGANASIRVAFPFC